MCIRDRHDVNGLRDDEAEIERGLEPAAREDETREGARSEARAALGAASVSYTHLDVYKRQGVSVHGVGIGTDDLAVRYAPQGTSIAAPSELPGALARIIEHEL